MDTENWLIILGYVHLAAGLQGLFLVVLLNAYPAENRVPNRVLSILILAFSLIVLGVSLGATGLYSVVPHMIRLGDPMILLLGPSLLIYFTAIRTGRIPVIQWLHFLPFVGYLLVLLPFYLSPEQTKIAWVEVILTGTAEQSWLNILKVTHVTIYFLWVYSLLGEHKKQVRDFSPDMKETDLAWIRRLTGYMIFTAAFSLVTFFLSALGLFVTLQANFIIGLMMALLIYVMGYNALVKPKVFGDRDYPAWTSNSMWNTFTGGFSFDATACPDEKYLEQEREYLQQLQQFMEQKKPYLDSRLSLAVLSSQIRLPQYLISRIINEHAGLNFFDFVNHYRVREISARLSDPSENRFTILALANDAGFNSKSSFNTAFRKSTGFTPSEFRRQHQKYE